MRWVREAQEEGWEDFKPIRGDYPSTGRVGCVE